MDEGREEEIRRAIEVIERHIAALNAERERLTRAMDEVNRQADVICSALNDMREKMEARRDV